VRTVYPPLILPSNPVIFSFNFFDRTDTMATTATLRTLGGSVVIAVPKRILELIHIGPGSKVEMNVENGRLVVQPLLKPKYKLADLLAQCKPSDFKLTAEDRAWLDARPVGKEVW
jgi:antitoxin ChpS